MKEKGRQKDRLVQWVRRAKDWLLEDVGSESPDHECHKLSPAIDEEHSLSLAITDEEGLFTYVDKDFAQAFGYEEISQFREGDWRRLFKTETARKLARNITPVSAEDGDWEGVVPGLAKDGSEVKLYMNLAPTSEGGTVWRVRRMGEKEAKKMDEVRAGSGEDNGLMDKVADLREAVGDLEKCKTKGDVYNKALRVVDRVLDFDLCVLQLEEENTVMAKADPGEDGDESPVWKIVGGRLSTVTLKKGEVIQGTDLSRYFQGKVFGEQFSSFASLPIGRLGTLQVYHAEEEEFTDLDLDLLRLLTSYLQERILRVELEGEVRQQAIRDSLTDLYNRHYLDELLAKEVERANRYDHTISFLMLDVNGFKQVNDRYSHLTGDEVLKEIADLLRENVRGADLVVRYGGDEFLMVLPEIGNTTKAVVGRIKELMDDWNEETDLISFPLGMAVGTSHWKPGQSKDVEEVLKEADVKMYEAKGESNNAGR